MENRPLPFPLGLPPVGVEQPQITEVSTSLLARLSVLGGCAIPPAPSGVHRRGPQLCPATLPPPAPHGPLLPSVWAHAPSERRAHRLRKLPAWWPRARSPGRKGVSAPAAPSRLQSPGDPTEGLGVRVRGGLRGKRRLRAGHPSPTPRSPGGRDGPVWARGNSARGRDGSQGCWGPGRREDASGTPSWKWLSHPMSRFWRSRGRYSRAWKVVAGHVGSPHLGVSLRGPERCHRNPGSYCQALGTTNG